MCGALAAAGLERMRERAAADSRRRSSAPTRRWRGCFSSRISGFCACRRLRRQRPRCRRPGAKARPLRRLRRPPRHRISAAGDRSGSSHPAARRARDRQRRASRGRRAVADDADRRRSRRPPDGGVRARPDCAIVRAVPALTTALQDADPMVRGRAAEALGLIGDQSAGASRRRHDGRVHQAGSDRGADARRRAVADLAGGGRCPARTVRARAADRVGTARVRRARQRGTPGQRLVAGRVCAAAHQRSSGAAVPSAARPRAGPLHAGVRRARPGPAEGSHVDAAAGCAPATRGVATRRLQYRQCVRLPRSAARTRSLLSSTC